MFMKALDAMGSSRTRCSGNVAPDDTVKLVFNLSQGEDVRGPWNEEPDFDYVADPKAAGWRTAVATVNPDDRRPAGAREIVQAELTTQI
jgi:Mn-containing catalase